MIAFVLGVSFVVTFAVTWWTRGYGFGELRELFGLGKRPRGGGPGGP